MSLTPKELFVIEAVISNEFSENNYRLPSPTEEYDSHAFQCWSHSLDANGAIHGEKVSGKAMSGVVASLNKKGYAVSYGKGNDKTVHILEEGWKAYQEEMLK